MMDGQLYLLFVTVLMLFALAITLPVLRDIVREALDRRHEHETGEERTDGEQEVFDGSPATQPGKTTETPTRQECQHCGAENTGEFTFCQECAKPL